MLTRFKHRNIQQWLALISLSNNQIGLSLLAMLVGIATAGVIVVFRFAVEIPLVVLLPMSHVDDYEALSWLARAALLVAGGLLLILIFRPLTPEQRNVGVNHVILRMEKHQGYMPGFNLRLQFISAIIALLSGHTAGREGPAIHMGAGTASQIGQRLGLAHHRLRVLAGCGVASAIAACFNTPMAGVILAMEVVMLEYSIRGFIPIILASVTGAIVSEATLGAETAFVVPSLDMRSLLEIPYILALGVICGLVSAGFLHAIKVFQRLNDYSLWIKWGGLTLTTAVISVFLPELLGIGYDTVNQALAGQVVISSLLFLLLGKCFLASWGAAVGFPAGVIGPSVFIGAALGGIMGKLSALWLPDYPVSIGFYAVLGMAAMMGATLRAPLAALVALLELTANPNIIMPGMLAIVIANLVVSEVFNLPSAFQVQLGGNPIAQTPNPVQQMLRNTWVAQVMERNIYYSQRHLSIEQCEQVLQDKPEWLMLTEESLLLSPSDLAEAITQAKETTQEGDIDLLAIPANRQQAGKIPLRANLQDALDMMQQSQLHWLAVYRNEYNQQTIGVVSHEQIERFYRYRPSSHDQTARKS